MLKSISTWAFDPSRSAQEVFSLARSHGFEAVEVSIGSEGFPLSYQVNFDSTPDDCARVREAAEKEGIQLASMASGFGWDFPITSVNLETRAKGVELTQKALRVCSYLGIDAMLLVPGGVGADFIPGFVVTDYEEAWNNALASLKEIAPVAEEVGVTVGVENVWNKWLLSPLEFRSFLQEVNSPRVGCYFDVGNVVLTGYPEQWVRILGERITRVHFKDFKKSVGTLEGFCPLLEGDTNYPAVVQALEKANYFGPVTAEFFGMEDQLADISRAMDTILGRN
ncbi:L-ribulose-5-phosphate 3-epimerase UlaE [Abditibacteriota bacterium]|nr:L-ribulose-5-phosphate 3-epimerase UlaE [Abditibacteriota bacterium]